MIWKQTFTLEGLNNSAISTLVAHLGINFSEFGDDYLQATMPVDQRTIQPYGLLHGGASAALAETLGSMAGMLCLEDTTTHGVVGIEINANHLRGKREGLVTGTARPVRIGRTVQVWNIDVTDEDNKLICVSRLTLSVIKFRESQPLNG